LKYKGKAEHLIFGHGKYLGVLEGTGPLPNVQFDLGRCQDLVLNGRYSRVVYRGQEMPNGFSN